MAKAENKRAVINGAEIDYLAFGSGEKALIMLPGVGDGFQTAKGMALPFSLMYRNIGKAYRVYAVSRRNDLPEGFTIADMADDLSALMDYEGIENADFFGVSQGGMIAQELAIRHPEKVGKLVLAVTAARPNPILEDSINTWLDMSKKRDYAGIMLDTARRSYTEKYCKKSALAYKILSVLTKPKDFSRFEILARSCLSHDASERLGAIASPTLIIGGECDRVLGCEASRELHDGIKGSELYIYPGLSHGLYDEAPDFYDRVLSWLIK